MTFEAQKIYGSIIYSSESRLLIVQGRKTGKWSFPKGHKTEEESSHECSLRETYEETGLLIKDKFIEELQLAAGKYFIYKLKDEPVLISYDLNEIVEARWVSLVELRNYHYNCDIRSYIMNAHDIRHNKVYLEGHYILDEMYLLIKKKRLEEKRLARNKKCELIHTGPIESDYRNINQQTLFNYVEYF